MKLNSPKKRTLIYAALLVLLLGAGIMFRMFRGSGITASRANNPITFRYVKPGPNYNGTIFWVTNHSTNTIALTLSAIEVKVGSMWVIQSSNRMDILNFGPTGMSLLNPHSAGETTVDVPIQPMGTTWRARVNVQEVLSGIEDTTARVGAIPRFLRGRFRKGSAAIFNPFSKGSSFFGPATEAVSQEAYEE